jgi:predicted dehydrogenase
MSDKPKQVGLMGCGAVANYGHIPAILGTEGLELVSLYDPDAQALARTQERYGVPGAFADADAFFASGLDAVSVTSPAPCHKENVLQAAQHKLDVLCEKPLAMNGDEASQMISAMEAAGASLYTAFCYRFSPSALKIRELVRAKAIGETRSLRLIYNWDLHGKYETDSRGNRVIQKRREGRMLEGGPMVDCGTHQIDLALFWLGSPVTRFSSHGAWVDEYEAPDHMWLHMDHANGAHTLVEMSYSYHHTSKNVTSEFVYELIGTEGVIRYDRSAQRFAMENVQGSHEFEFHPEKSFAGMYAEWARALVTGSSDLLTSAQEGMRVVEIARQATDAAIENRTNQ